MSAKVRDRSIDDIKEPVPYELYVPPSNGRAIYDSGNKDEYSRKCKAWGAIQKWDEIWSASYDERYCDGAVVFRKDGATTKKDNLYYVMSTDTVLEVGSMPNNTFIFTNPSKIDISSVQPYYPYNHRYFMPKVPERGLSLHMVGIHFLYADTVVEPLIYSQYPRDTKITAFIKNSYKDFNCVSKNMSLSSELCK